MTISNLPAEVQAAVDLASKPFNKAANLARWVGIINGIVAIAGCAYEWGWVVALIVACCLGYLEVIVRIGVIHLTRAIMVVEVGREAIRDQVGA
jgi:hypothetical protein